MKKSKLSLLAVAAMALMFSACNPETPEVDPDAGKTDQTEQEEKKDSETEEKDTDDKDSEDKDSEKKDDEDKDSKKEDENPPATLYVGTWVNAAGSKKVLFTADGKFKWAEKDTSGNSLVAAMYIKGTYTVSGSTISATGTNISFENEDESWMTFAEFKEFLLAMEADAASIDAMISVYSNIQWTYTATETTLSLSSTKLGQNTFTKSTDTDVTIANPAPETNPLENYVYKPAPQITLPDSVSPEDFPFAYGTRYMLSPNNNYIIFNANGKAIYGSRDYDSETGEYKYVPSYELAYTVDTENKCIYTKRTKISYSVSSNQSELKSYDELIEFNKNAFSSKEGLRTNLLTDYMKEYILYYMYYYENGKQDPSNQQQLDDFAATKSDDDFFKAFIYYTCMFELCMEEEAAENVTFAQFANLMMNDQEEYLLTKFSMICKFSYSYNETSNVMTLTREFVDNFSMNNLFPKSSVYLISEDGKLTLEEYGLHLQVSDTKWQSYGYYSHTDSEITFYYSEKSMESKSITVPYTFTAPTSKADVILTITFNETEYKMKYNTNEYNSYNFYKINNFSNNSTSD